MSRKPLEQAFIGGSRSTQTVAVCIPTYNQRKYLPLALESIVRQIKKPDEIWISDDASTDGTQEYLAQFEKDVGKSVRTTIIPQKTNIGMVANTDFIMRMAQADFIVKLDSDDFLHENYILTLSNALSVTPNAAYAHCAVREINSLGEERRIRRLARSNGFQSAREAIRRSIHGYNVAANVCMFRRQALEAVQYYRLNLSFAEDWDLAFRLAAAGYGNIYIKEILASYRVWDDDVGIRASRKNNELKAIKNIFEEVIEPRVGQDGKLFRTMEKAKRNLAVSHATCLAARNLSAHDREILKRGVLDIDDSIFVRIHLWFNQAKVGSLVVVTRKLRIMAKDLVKHIFFR